MEAIYNKDNNYIGQIDAEQGEFTEEEKAEGYGQGYFIYPAHDAEYEEYCHNREWAIERLDDIYKENQVKVGDLVKHKNPTICTKTFLVVSESENPNFFNIRQVRKNGQPDKRFAQSFGSHSALRSNFVKIARYAA